MADTVDNLVLFNGGNIYKVRCLNHSDGTGESAVVKVDKSTLIGPNGVAPGRLAIRRVTWAIFGFEAVKVLFDHTTDDEALMLSGSGYEEFDPPLVDPNTSGDTGDILFTTVSSGAGAAGDSYNITLELVLKA